MELYAKGQLSYLILNCLLERDFYGLDIITEIRDRSDGNINLKKPSVYSNLTRMEKQGYVSSYLKSSDLGPNRKYYSVTEKGRNFYSELKEYFDRNRIDVFRDFSDDDAQETPQNNATFISFAQPAPQQPIFEEETNKTEELDEEETEENNEEISQEETFKQEESDYFDFSFGEIEDKQSPSQEEENEIEMAQPSQEERQTSFDNFIHYDFHEESEETVKEPTFEQEDTNQITEEFESEEIQEPLMEENTTEETTEKQIQKEETFTSTQSQEIEEDDDEIIASFPTYEEEKQLEKEEMTEPEIAPIQNISPANEVKEEIREEPKTPERVDDAVFLSNENAADYNQKLYDISKDISRNKRKKSFADDQISISVDSPLSASNERTQNNIESLKSSFETNKNTYEPKEPQLNHYNFYNQVKSQEIKRQEQKVEVKTEPLQDDAKYITGRIEGEIERARKIEPPRLKLMESAVRENRLPAPKRDTNIDPSHKEILSRLYSKTKDSTAETVRSDALYDYTDLKDFYKGQNISFNEYKKPEKHYHNTNKLYFILSLLSFLAVGIASALLYVILFTTNQLFNQLDFLFIVLPVLVIFDVVAKFINYKKFSGWLPEKMLSQWKIWLITFSLLTSTVLINLAFGLGFKEFYNYSTTLLLPAIMIILLVPVRYYFKRFMLVKFWK